MKQIFLSIGLLFLISSAANACIGAKAAGIGYAGVSNSEDATSIYWNQAALPFVGNNISLGNRSINKNNYVAISQSNFGFCYVATETKQYAYVGYGRKINSNFSLGYAIGLLNDYFYHSLEYLLAGSLLYQTTYVNYGILLQGDNLRPSMTLKYHNLSYTLEIYDALHEESYYYAIIKGLKYETNHFYISAGEKEYLNCDYKMLTYGCGIKLTNHSINIAKEDDSVSLSVSLGR